MPEEGSIYFDDDDVTKLPPHKRGTAMMFQSYALWPHLNVFKNVAFGLEERRVSKEEIRERVLEALEMVQMGGLENRKINQLSGGQQQRVALARALVVRPRCLMLDEPLSNLDAKLRVEMRTEIRRICKEFGLTAIYVTHDQKEALSIADRMAILDGGHFAQIGTPEEVYRSPNSKLVASFIGETNFIPGQVERMDGKQVIVKSSYGFFRGRAEGFEDAPQAGADVCLSIRPECFALSDQAEDENSISGHLSQSIYLGEIAQYSLGIGENEPGEIRIAELNPRRVVRDASLTLYASANPEDVVVLPPN